MKILNIHGGHNLKVPGANKLFNEVTEDRKVKDLVIGKMKSLGYTVYDCTDDSGKTQNENLKNIVSKCNDNTVDLDISIHFNASNGQGHGVEVLQYSDKTQAIAQNICNAIAQLGFKNRGVKERKDLYVLKKTKAPAILIECCFCDSEIDASLYNANKMASAIVKGLTGVDLTVNKTKIAYAGHIQDIGWTAPVTDGATCGTVGENRRLEAIQIDTRHSNLDMSAKAHIANVGWKDYGKINNNTVIGTVGQSNALECLCLNCTNANIVYRVHQANIGWSSWTKADGISTLGSVGQSLQLEAIEIKVI
ncbi:N-acetylmuramoyl-L-alanine amidase [Thomasclavelia cocleata]|uniref:N-acetylmuramoyl-L-alanine amidase n=1 Tax=Thomasclavelia cocleata TaxID=69824 RepID=UPI0025711B5A|nr:N-acetylmuramoyl-L-alanine amidase [Thomasclavelia cocleata]